MQRITEREIRAFYAGARWALDCFAVAQQDMNDLRRTLAAAEERELTLLRDLPYPATIAEVPVEIVGLWKKA